MNSVVSYPNRGPWGKNSYRGNCSGYIIKDIVQTYEVKKLAELFAGSGTGADVCDELGIDYIGADLNCNFVHKNIMRSYDAIKEDVPDSFRDAEFLFMHPPYGKEIQIPYAGSQWNKTEFIKEKGYDPCQSDLGQMPWTIFMNTLNQIIIKFYASIQTGARMGVLCGEVRRGGTYYSMLLDLVRIGKLESVVVKIQHNCTSEQNQYSSKNFNPIVHENLMIFKKTSPYVLDFILPKVNALDIRDSKKATWEDVIYAAMAAINKPCSLSDLYTQIQFHKKAKENQFWKEKTRQILQTSKLFSSKQRGIWALNIAS